MIEVDQKNYDAHLSLLSCNLCICSRALYNSACTNFLLFAFSRLVDSSIILTHLVLAGVRTAIVPLHIAFAVHGIVTVISFIDFTGVPLERTFAKLLVVLEITCVLVSICLLNLAVTLELAINEGSSDNASPRVVVDALSVDSTQGELTLVALSIGPRHGPLSVHLVVVPVALVVARSGEHHPTVPYSLTILPFALVKGSIWPFVSAIASHFSIDKVALVDVSLGHLIVTYALAVIFFPLPFIRRAIWVPHLAEAVSLVFDPITFVVSAIWPGSLSFTVAQVS